MLCLLMSHKALLVTSQESYQPTEVCKGLWIVPDWCHPPDPSALNIRMAPGLAFGTGKQLCQQSCMPMICHRDD